MPFPECTKREARKRSNFRCVVCNDVFVEVHHIHPQAEGGSDDIMNAAPLCGSCHNKYGGNPALRKQLREMRDACWERTTTTIKVTAAGLLDEIPEIPLRNPYPQKIRWGPVDSLEAGITVYGSSKEFVPWSALSVEIEKRLLTQLGRSLPVDCRVVLSDFHGHRDWLVQIVGPDSTLLADLWFGPDPDSDWRYDGRVRVGRALDDYYAEVWQVFERFSDGTYHRIEARK